MNIGETAELTRAYTAEDLALYHQLGGSSVRTGEVPGPLINALFSYLLGVKLPGPGTNYLKQQTVFTSPARLGEMIRARVEITRIRSDKSLVDLSTLCTGENNREICNGRALVFVGDVPKS